MSLQSPEAQILLLERLVNIVRYCYSTWHETQDHSKWAIALDASNTLCISDINRMESQRNRGGGTVCFKHSALRNILYNSITSSADCN